MGVLPAFLDALRREYDKSRLFEVLTMDAGFCSPLSANARLINDANFSYVFGLKGNQPELQCVRQINHVSAPRTRYPYGLRR